MAPPRDNPLRTTLGFEAVIYKHSTFVFHGNCHPASHVPALGFDTFSGHRGSRVETVDR